MGLPARPMHVPAGLAIDESTRPELLDVGQSNVANRNVRGLVTGALDKRLGFATETVARIDGSNRTAGRRMFAHGSGDVPCIIDGTHIDIVDETLDVSVRRSLVPEAHYRPVDVPTVGRGAIVADVACVNGYIFTLEKVFRSGPANDFYVSIVDAVTGVVVRGPEFVNGINSNGEGGLATLGTSCMFGVCDSATDHVILSRIDTASAATIASGWSGVASIAVTGGTTGQLAMASLPTQPDKIAIAYDQGAGASRVVVQTVNVSGVVASQSLSTSSSQPEIDSIDLSENGSTLWVSWALGHDAVVIGLDPASIAGAPLASAVVAFTLTDDVERLFVVSRGAGLCAVAGWSPSDPLTTVNIKTTAGAAALDGIAAGIYNASIAGRPFLRGTSLYAWFASDTFGVPGNGPSASDNITLCEWTFATSPAARYLRPVVAPIYRGLVATDIRAARCRTPATGSDTYAFAFVAKRTGLSSGTEAVEIDFADRQRWQPVTHHGTTILGGGVTSTFDGSLVVEAGFLCAPTQPSVDVSGSGSQTFTSGGRRYVAIYAAPDAIGNLHVSGVSQPSFSTGNITSKSVVATVYPLSITSRGPQAGVDASVQVFLYATTDGGEPPYYFVDSASSSPEALITIEDALDETTLASNPKLYAPSLPGAVGESQDRRSPPGLRNPISYAGMLVGSCGESLFTSGQEVSGEATWFTPIFETPISGGGDITAIAQQDGSLVVFKRNRVYVVAGETPSDNGAAGGLGAPRLVCADLGCIDAASVVTTSVGVFFQSERGLEVLSRSQTVAWIGEPILATVAAYPIITSAVVDARNTIVRFALSSGVSDGVATGDAREAIYDLSVNAWMSVDDKAAASQSAACVSINGARRYAWLAADGFLWVERDDADTNAYRDGSAWVTAQYTLPPWKLGLQQEQRIFETELLFENHGSAGLTIEVAEDYGAFGATTADKVWTLAQLDGQREVSWRPRSHGIASQYRVRDTEGTGLGELDKGQGFSFLGMSSDIAPKQGPTRGTTRLSPDLRR